MGSLKKILVTGANGFVGSHVLKLLLKNSFCPILILRKESSLWRIRDLVQDSKCVIYYSDASSFYFGRIFEDHQIYGIIHLATDYGRDSSLADIVETNVIFPIKLLETGNEFLKIFINTDTFFAKPQFNQTYLKQYTNSKRALENILKAYNGKVKIVNLRLEHVFGELDADGKFFTSTLKNLLENKKTIQLTEGIQKRDFIYVEDVARAYILILKRLDFLESYQEFEVGRGSSITIRDFVIKLAEFANSTSKLNFGALKPREGDIEESNANNQNLINLGWEIKNTLDKEIQSIIRIEKTRFDL
ncbi:MAG: NAD-dependent epimerase/dehydratase [Pedobacter sp.]|uniref:NAD-dependent epimerase/dehydratase n=1 Tax=Pedobacter sp. TaxID=1411316 RepID=UPI00280A030D|nr:NAD-dependent epimerase/dehydratase [Pedobacter sp.]MDQ8004333.1 NAD-dependent epimerase/dehydratase [Pedobacter sp.]